MDGHDTEHTSYDYFGKSFEELKEVDGNRNRTIKESYKAKIKDLINSTHGWDFGDN